MPQAKTSRSGHPLDHALACKAALSGRIHFGDDWRHTIRVEAITKAVPDMSYPRFLEGEGRCPPEDVGGAWGYAAFLAAITDPTHERHAELLEWSGPFDPTDTGETAIRRELGKLTQPPRRKKKPTAGRTTP
jgi:hypothetical protein